MGLDLALDMVRVQSSCEAAQGVEVSEEDMEHMIAEIGFKKAVMEKRRAQYDKQRSVTPSPAPSSQATPIPTPQQPHLAASGPRGGGSWGIEGSSFSSGASGASWGSPCVDPFSPQRAAAPQSVKSTPGRWGATAYW